MVELLLHISTQLRATEDTKELNDTVEWADYWHLFSTIVALFESFALLQISYLWHHSIT